MGGSDTTQSTQSQQVTQLPPWINNAAQQNYAYAQNVAMRPLQQYQGQMVADVSPQMQQSWNTAATGANAGQDQLNAAQAGYLGVMGQQPQQVTAGQLSNTDLSPYMNPYTQDVINKTLPIMQQNLALSQNQQQNAASSANAFGGSRQAIQQGVTQAQGAQGMAQMAAQLNQANFGQAQTAAQQDISGRMQAALANQGAQQNQAGLNIQAASGMGALGNQAQKNQAQQFIEQMTAGQAEQAQQQAVINANMAKFQQANQYPTQQLGILQSALGMTPYGSATQGQQTTETQTAANPITAITGGLGALGDLFSAPAGGTSAASGLGALFGLSDRSMKTDIHKVGQHPAGVGIYSYRYRGDPKSYPKVVGPMAEDVAKIAPHAVSVIPGSGGKRAVNMGALSALTPRPIVGGAAPAVPGALAGSTPLGPVGALGGSMRLRPPRMMGGRVRPPQLMGALGG